MTLKKAMSAVEQEMGPLSEWEVTTFNNMLQSALHFKKKGMLDAAQGAKIPADEEFLNWAKEKYDNDIVDIVADLIKFFYMKGCNVGREATI